MFERRLYLLIILITVLLRVSAQTDVPNLEFIENKGQWDSRALLKADIGNGSLYFHKKGIRVILHNEQEMADMAASHGGVVKPDSGRHVTPQRSFSGRPGALRAHAYAVNFLNMNEATEIIPDKPLDTYNNYFIGNDSTKWARNCRIFQGVTYKNIYPGIDLRYYTDNGNLKYDLIIHPGANPENIAMQYEGLDGLTVTNNRLLLKTSVGDVKEMEPYRIRQATMEGNPSRSNTGFRKTGSCVSTSNIITVTVCWSLTRRWYSQLLQAAGHQTGVSQPHRVRMELFLQEVLFSAMDFPFQQALLSQISAVARMMSVS